MTDFSILMPPLTTAAIEALAIAFIAEFAPEMFESPRPLNVAALIEGPLEQHGIHFAPASAAEMGDMLGATDWTTQRGINVLMREDEWRELFTSGPLSHRPRGTAAHELGHVILHVAAMRQAEQAGKMQAALLPRMSTQKPPAYMDPEWQAWTFAGFILAPRDAILRCNPEASVADLAAVFKVSVTLMRNHLKRCGIER